MYNVFMNLFYGHVVCSFCVFQKAACRVCNKRIAIHRHKTLLIANNLILRKTFIVEKVTSGSLSLTSPKFQNFQQTIVTSSSYADTQTMGGKQLIQYNCHTLVCVGNSPHVNQHLRHQRFSTTLEQNGKREMFSHMRDYGLSKL